jgi:hypothetical protein
MKTLLTMLRDFLAAQQTKADAKVAWTSKGIGDDDYHDARSAFRSADDACESLFEQVVPALQFAQAHDELESVLVALGAADTGSLRNLLSERGLHTLLDALPTSLGGSITRYRKASAIFTAARELNARRRQLVVEDFEERIDTPPAGVDEESWQKVLGMLRDEERAIEAELGDESGVDPEEVLREAAYRLENLARARYDTIGERLVEMIRSMMDRGSFEYEAAQLDAELRRALYDIQRRVPMPQLQTQPKPAPRPVEVLDR